MNFLTSKTAQDIFLGLVRHIGTGTGGILVAAGYLQSNQVNSWLGSICFIGGVTWSAWQKYEANKKLTTTANNTKAV